MWLWFSIDGTRWNHVGTKISESIASDSQDGAWFWIPTRKISSIPEFVRQNPAITQVQWLSGSIWLVVGPPLWKIWKSIGMIIPFLYRKIMFQTTNQTIAAMWKFLRQTFRIFQVWSHSPNLLPTWPFRRSPKWRDQIHDETIKKSGGKRTFQFQRIQRDTKIAKTKYMSIYIHVCIYLYMYIHT